MKAIYKVSIMLVALVSASFICQAQNLNWASLRQGQRHTLNVNAGFDYATTLGLGYGYQIKSKLPTVFNIEYSEPVGGNLFDDFRTKTGAQVRLLQLGNFHFTAKVQGVFRRFENDYARLLNFGSNTAAIVGYYKARGYVAGEVGFDKAIITHFKSSELYRENFPGAKNGWYEPATGGNLYYGIQAGYSFRASDVTLKLGRVVEEDFVTNPAVPYYLQFGYNWRF